MFKPHFRSIVATCKCEFEILDYTSAHLITINNGYSKIQDGTFRIIHPIDLNLYNNFLTQTETYVKQNIPETNPLLPILKEELNQTADLIKGMYPINNLNNISFSNKSRNKRSFNILGTAWKYIAGSPDHDDFEMLEFNLSTLSQNSNKQVVINEILNDRINNVTEIINKMSNAIGKGNYITNEIIINLQNRIRLIKEQLININYAIQWAKNGIINSLILNKFEIKIALDKLREERMPFASAEEAVEYAKVSIILKNSVILYVIKIPLTNDKIFENIIIRPVKKYKKIVKLPYKEIIKENNKIYGLKNNCKKFNKIQLCNENDLIDLSKDNCIPNVIKGLESSCPFLNNQHIPRIEKIFPGVILLNDFNDTIEIDKNRQYLCGTFLIKFTNSTIVAENKTYLNFEAPQIETIPSVLQPTPIETNLENLLTIESLHELHINNTHEIKNIKFGTIINGVSSMFIFISLAATIFSILCFLKFPKNTNVPNSYSPTSPAVILANVQPGINPQNPTLRFNDVPYF